MEFRTIKEALEKNLSKMSNEHNHLFVADVDKDELWELYLNSIPAEDNKIFRVRKEYDCSCCRHFIKNMGGVVAITADYTKKTIWDFETSDPKWNGVIKVLDEYVKSKPLVEVFLSKEGIYGTDHNMLQTEGEIFRFEHFYFKLPEKYIVNDRNSTIGTERGLYVDSKNVFKRSLDEIPLDAIDTVLDLINQGSLYKGNEYLHSVNEFKKHKVAYDKQKGEGKELYAWLWSAKLKNSSVTKIRNTAIGTLLVDVSEGLDLEEAVKKYETITAPANYKRSKPIFTKKMLEEAQKTIEELGFMSSLERRYACADDITVNNILFSNKDTAKRIEGAGNAFFSDLEKDVNSAPKKFDRVEEIGVEKFISDVLPSVSEVEAYVETKHIPNFMSLIAPVHKDSKTMFKWNNNFSWAYAGNVTDSILKQNVKNAGGDVNGVLRFSIQWNDLGDYDMNDEDAHCTEPGGFEIFYGSCKRPSRSSMGGQLDVDITHPIRDVAAVENITWPDINKMKDGIYKFFVHCFTQRGGRSGFRAEIEFDGNIYSFDYAIPMKQDQIVEVAYVKLENGKFTIENKLPSNCSSKEIWNVKTNTFVPVNVICLSPNYWDEQNGIGNKHYFFMLKDCVNPELPNSFYNEFLCDELYPKHRKVMEALSSRAHVLESPDQLSGLGFSSTLRNDLVVKLKGATDRLLKIRF